MVGSRRLAQGRGELVGGSWWGVGPQWLAGGHGVGKGYEWLCVAGQACTDSPRLETVSY
jgi:hypothetical protein